MTNKDEKHSQDELDQLDPLNVFLSIGTPEDEIRKMKLRAAMKAISDISRTATFNLPPTLGSTIAATPAAPFNPLHSGLQTPDGAAYFPNGHTDASMDELAELANDNIIDALAASLSTQAARATDFAEVEHARRAAENLALSLFKKHYASNEGYASGRIKFELADTLRGVLSQIDNMTCGLKAPAAAPVALHDGVEELIKALVNAESNKTRLHQEFMGKPMPDSSYDQFHRLRDELIPALWIQLRALLAGVSAPAAVAVPDGGTPGKWRVRKRESDGKLLGCFVAAPDCQGRAYDAEILGDDYDTVARKLADCELIVTAVNAHRAMLAATPATSAQDVQRVTAAVIEKLPRYSYGYKSDEWGENRALRSYQADDGRFLDRSEVIAAIDAARAAQGGV